jgi:hypothetical protein
MRAATAAILRQLDATVTSDQGRPLAQGRARCRAPYEAIMDKAVGLGLAGDSAAATQMLLRKCGPGRPPTSRPWMPAGTPGSRMQQRQAAIKDQAASSDGLLMLAMAPSPPRWSWLGAWAITRSIVRSDCRCREGGAHGGCG